MVFFSDFTKFVAKNDQMWYQAHMPWKVAKFYKHKILHLMKFYKIPCGNWIFILPYYNGGPTIPILFLHEKTQLPSCVTPSTCRGPRVESPKSPPTGPRNPIKFVEGPCVISAKAKAQFSRTSPRSLTCNFIKLRVPFRGTLTQNTPCLNHEQLRPKPTAQIARSQTPVKDMMNV